MPEARGAEIPREGGSPSNRRFLYILKREANVPRELYRTWVWRGPAAVVNRAGQASLTVRPHASAEGFLEARLSLSLSIYKGSERSAWLYYDHATAKVYKHQVPLVLCLPPGMKFGLHPVPNAVLMDSKGRLQADLMFTATVPVTEASRLPSNKFRALVSGLEMELAGAGARGLWPVLVRGACE